VLLPIAAQEAARRRRQLLLGHRLRVTVRLDDAHEIAAGGRHAPVNATARLDDTREHLATQLGAQHLHLRLTRNLGDDATATEHLAFEVLDRHRYVLDLDKRVAADAHMELALLYYYPEFCEELLEVALECLQVLYARQVPEVQVVRGIQIVLVR